MLGKLIWKETGDELEFSVTFPDLFEYWVDKIDSEGVNSFCCNFSKFDSSIVERLKKDLLEVEKISNKVRLEIANWHGDILDQNYLNQLHRQWVKTGIKYPNITKLLRVINGLDTSFRDINNNIHNLENCFVYQFLNYDVDPYQVKNIFGTSVLGWDVSNLSLGFDNLGRSSWEKFRNLDDNLHDTDTNNFDMLSGKIDLSLQRPWSGLPPVEYVNWCKDKNVAIVGKTISLGNIVDLESKLGDIRKILIRNTYEQSNKFFFKICS